MLARAEAVHEVKRVVGYLYKTLCSDMGKETCYIIERGHTPEATMFVEIDPDTLEYFIKGAWYRREKVEDAVEGYNGTPYRKGMIIRKGDVIDFYGARHIAVADSENGSVVTAVASGVPKDNIPLYLTVLDGKENEGIRIFPKMEMETDKDLCGDSSAWKILMGKDTKYAWLKNALRNDRATSTIWDRAESKDDFLCKLAEYKVEEADKYLNDLMDKSALCAAGPVFKLELCQVCGRPLECPEHGSVEDHLKREEQ